MSSPSTLKSPLARTAALVCSVSLAAFVVVNAQSGCDSNDSQIPDPSPDAAASAPTKEAARVPAPIEPKPAGSTTPATGEPAAATEAGTDVVERMPPSSGNANAAAKPPMPALMPASKSGGDFGAMRFPGDDSKKPSAQKPSTQPSPQQHANPAPNQAQKAGAN